MMTHGWAATRWDKCHTHLNPQLEATVGRPEKRGLMATNSTATVLRVLPTAENPAPVALRSDTGPYGLNTLRAVSDFGPSELFELDAEIAAYVEKIDKLQRQRTYLSRLMDVAREYYTSCGTGKQETKRQTTNSGGAIRCVQPSSSPSPR